MERHLRKGWRVKGFSDTKLPGVIFGYQSYPYRSDDDYPKSMWDKKMWYLYEANEPIVLYDSISNSLMRKLENGYVKNNDQVIVRMKFGFFTSQALGIVQKQIPRPEADIYVKVLNKKGEAAEYVNYHGEKAVRQIIIKKKGIIRLSEEHPVAGLRMLRRRKFSSHFWEYRNFIEKEEFEKIWHDLSSQ